MKRRGFTLVELLAVIGILVALTTLTAISIQRIAKDTRLSTATNALVNALSDARLQAMAEQRPMLLLMVPRVERFGPRDTDPVRRQWVEAVLGRLSEPMVPQNQDSMGGQVSRWYFMDIFELHPGFTPVRLPDGIKVAAPDSDNSDSAGTRDDIWRTQPDFRNQERGGIVGVLFGPSGELLTKLSGSGMTAVAGYRSIMMDLDGDGAIREGEGYDNLYWIAPDDERRVTPAKILAVFDDTAARQAYDAERWSGDGYQRIEWGKPCSGYVDGVTRMQCEQSEFIRQFADFITVNRVTGRVEVRRR